MRHSKKLRWSGNIAAARQAKAARRVRSRSEARCTTAEVGTAMKPLSADGQSFLAWIESIRQRAAEARLIIEARTVNRSGRATIHAVFRTRRQVILEYWPSTKRVVACGVGWSVASHDAALEAAIKAAQRRR